MFWSLLSAGQGVWIWACAFGHVCLAKLDFGGMTWYDTGRVLARHSHATLPGLSVPGSYLQVTTFFGFLHNGGLLQSCMDAAQLLYYDGVDRPLK